MCYIYFSCGRTDDFIRYFQVAVEKGEKGGKNVRARKSWKSIVSFKIEKLWSKVKKVSIIVNLFLTIGKGICFLGGFIIKI